MEFEESLASCRLCPRACGVDRAAGERGVCGAQGELVVARAARTVSYPEVFHTTGSAKPRARAWATAARIWGE